MSKIFKCGDIANIINDSETEVKPKKRSKLDKKFKAIIEENQNKVIEINNKKDLNVKIETSDDEEDNEDIEGDTQDLNTSLSAAEIAEKNERTAFVGNLPKTVKTKLLKRMFKKFGPIDSIRLRGAVPQKEKISKKVAAITRNLHPGKDNIIAYVVFKTKDCVLRALKLNGTVLEGHHIRVDSAIHDSTHDNTRSVFVGNLPFVVREDELFEFFKDCGEVESVRVVRDSATGVGKGFGFILFKSKDSVILALEMNDKKLLGREIRVTRAKGNITPTTKGKNNNQDKRKFQNRKHSPKEPQTVDNTEEPQTEEPQKPNKKVKKSDSKPEFEGISAKKMKKKTNKKKELLSTKTKRKHKKLAQIFSK